MMITLLGKKHPIRITMSVLAAVERESSINNILLEAQTMGVGESILLAYHGCKKADPTFSLSLEEVGDAFTAKSMMEVFDALAETLPEIAGEEKKE